MELTLKQKRLLKWIGYPLLALVTFLFAVFYTFPYDRLKDKIETSLSKKYDVEISSIGPTLIPGGVVLEGLRLQTRPEKPDDKPQTIFIDQVELDFGLFAALTGSLNVDIEADIGSGTVEGEVSYSKAGLEATIDVDALPLASVPGLGKAVGLPMAGALNGTLAIKLPLMKWRDADGHVKLSCENCTVGDGKAKLEMKPRKRAGRLRRRPSFFASGGGLTVPRLSLGNAVVEVEIEKGVGKIKALEATSKDGHLEIDGEIQFRDPVKTSTFPACMKFKLSDSLKKRKPKFGSIENFLHPKLRQPDGSYAIPTKGTLGALRWDRHRVCKSAAPGSGARARPTITARPPEDDKRGERTNVPALGAVDDKGGDEEPSDTEKARRVGQKAKEAERELWRPGSSGPTLSPADRGDKSEAGDESEARDGEQGDETADEGPPEGERDEAGEPQEGEPVEGEPVDEPLEGEPDDRGRDDREQDDGEGPYVE